LVGPGLFFALLAALVTPLKAETAVGLDAVGVDPLVSLSNPGNLDVRDAQGRPVSATLVAAQVKQARAKAASEAAFASRLPEAAAVAAFLEMLQALRHALRGGPISQPVQDLFALVPTFRTTDKTSPTRALILGLALLVAGLVCRPALLVVPIRSRRCDQLRC
jgi:hypothetical protein